MVVIEMREITSGRTPHPSSSSLVDLRESGSTGSRKRLSEPQALSHVPSPDPLTTSLQLSLLLFSTFSFSCVIRPHHIQTCYQPTAVVERYAMSSSSSQASFTRIYMILSCDISVQLKSPSTNMPKLMEVHTGRGSLI